MVEPKATVRESLERIAISLESIALFLQVMMEDQAPIDELASSVNTVMTQDGPIALRQTQGSHSQPAPMPDNFA